MQNKHYIKLNKFFMGRVLTAFNYDALRVERISDQDDVLNGIESKYILHIVFMVDSNVSKLISDVIKIIAKSNVISFDDFGPLLNDFAKKNNLVCDGYSTILDTYRFDLRSNETYPNAHRANYVGPGFIP